MELWWKSHRNPKGAPYKSRRGCQENWTKWETKAIVKDKRKVFGQFSSQKKLDTKEDPHNNHTIEDQGQSWDFDPDWGPSFGKNLADSKRKGARKRRNKSYSKGKETTILENVHPKKKLDTKEDPQKNNHTIADQGCSWTTTFKNCLGAMF